MRSLKKLPLWCLLITKRLFVRPGFLVLILLVPLLVLGMSFVGSKNSGIISIALAANDPNDATAREVIDTLTDNDPLIRFTLYDTPEKARQAVTSAEAEAAWIFPARMQERIKAFVLSPSEENYVVDILQREENIVLKLANERLCGAMYSICSHELYLDYIRESLPGLSHLSDSELLDYYEETLVNGDLFSFGYLEEEGARNINYLTSPLRGLLYILAVMGGLAAAMFYQRDEESGFIHRIPKNERFGFELVCHLLPSAYILLASVISLMISGLGVGLLAELATAVVYSFACAAMCMLIRRIFRKPEWLAVVTPLFVILLIAICPVFISTNATRPIQVLLAPYYALNAVYNPIYIIYTAVYALVLTSVDLVLYKLKNKQ